MARIAYAMKIPLLMGKIFIGLSLAVLTLAAWFFAARAAEPERKLTGPERIDLARKARGALIAERCRSAGLPYPPREIFLRALKREAELELWAREDLGAFHLIHTFPILAPSGVPGPKRKAGDRQVPEGFYRIDRFNPQSAYHLSLGLNYPNSDDLRYADRSRPGGDIFIHGKAVTIGCIPIGDPAIEELFVIAFDTRLRGQVDIPVHIYPARMSGPEWESFSALHIARNPALADFWRTLQSGFDTFDRDHRSLEISRRAGD